MISFTTCLRTTIRIHFPKIDRLPAALGCSRRAIEQPRPERQAFIFGSLVGFVVTVSARYSSRWLITPARVVKKLT